VHIEKMLAAIPGVQSASVELVRGSISVLHDGVDPDELKRAVISAGVPAELAGD
jgi:copper chaperone CopZ